MCNPDNALIAYFPAHSCYSWRLWQRLLANRAHIVGKPLRRIGNGMVRRYALLFLIGAVGILWYLAARF